MKHKQILIQFIAVFCIELILFLPISLVDALSISNVDTQDIGAHSAKVTWNTDEVAKGKVRYGPTESLGSQRSHNTFIFDHEISIAGLQTETTYFFEL